MADELTEALLKENAAAPAEVTGDGGTVKEHPLPDQIKVLDRQAGIDAVTGTNNQGGPKSPWGSLRPARVVPPGSV